MGKQVATVTRTGTTENPFIAYVASGMLGAYRTAGEAQRAADTSNGARHLRWVRADLNGDIEHYIGRSPDWYPLDIPSRLDGWWDSDQGVQPVQVGGLDKVVEWNSFDGSGDIEATQTVPANGPTLVAAAAPNGLNAVRFSTASAETLNTNLSVTDEYTVSMAAAYQPTGNPTEQLASFGTVLQVNAGNWEMVTDLGTVVGPAAVAGQPVVLTVVTDGVNAAFYVDGTAIGAVAYTAGAFPVSFSEGLNYFGGDLYSAVIAESALPPTTRAALINYQKRRYNVA
jgi:hypothetical protein